LVLIIAAPARWTNWGINAINLPFVSNDLFPSGPWIGFYKYSGSSEKYRMDLDLSFANGNMTGSGIDNIGPFLIQGRYDSASQECYWTKTYIGAHDVFYRGFREGKGIWGTWEIGLYNRGGFHIWPLHSGQAEQTAISVEQQEPVTAALVMTGEK